MKKQTLLKLLCLAVVCAMVLPFVFACGEEPTAPTAPSQNPGGIVESVLGSVLDSNGSGTNDSGTTDDSILDNESGDTDASSDTNTSESSDTNTSESSDNSSDVSSDNESDESSDTSSSSDVDDVKVTIIFRPGRGQVVSGEAEIQIAQGARLTADMFPEVSREGYVLTGWYFNSQCTDAWDETRTFAEDAVLFAGWEADEGSDTSSDSSVTTPDSKDEEKPTDSSNNTPDSKDEEKPTDSSKEDTTNSSDKPAIQKITIKFSVRGGTVLDGEVEIEIEKGSTITAIMTPELERAGYTFKGWTYDREGSVEWFEEDEFDADTTLYAQWAEKTPDSSSGGTTDSSDDDKPATEKITITFSPRGGTVLDGKLEITINKGGKITINQTPELERAGYIFKCWSYDRIGAEEWFDDEPFNEDTTLYAQWTEKNPGGSSDSSNTPGSSNTDTPGGNPDTPDTPPAGSITISYETGAGYFESDDDWEKVITSGSRFTKHPTPIHEDPSMKFEGWFTDSAFTTPVSLSTKYTADTTLYAKWTQQVKCLDGSYDHLWTAWDTDSLPTCTTAGVMAQFCQTCNAKNTMEGDPAKGHSWRPWEEGFLRRQRTCSTLGCGVEQYQEFENITLSTLGNDPAAQMKLEMGAGWGSNRVTAVVDGNWDNANSATFCGNSCEVKVTINLKTPSTMDRIYVKGHGAGSAFNIYVQYEGDSDYTLIGSGGFLAAAQNEDKENRQIPYGTVDNTRNVVSVQVVMPNASYGQDYWDEVAFIKIPPIEAE